MRGVRARPRVRSCTSLKTKASWIHLWLLLHDHAPAEEGLPPCASSLPRRHHGAPNPQQPQPWKVSSPLELIKTTVCIFAARRCSNAMELVEGDQPLQLPAVTSISFSRSSRHLHGCTPTVRSIDPTDRRPGWIASFLQGQDRRRLHQH